MTFRTNEVLSSDECYALLGREGIGRIAYNDDLGPVALPVNFAVIERDVLVRTQPTSVLAHGVDRDVGFEVDHIDPVDRSGWSVLLRGRARTVPMTLVPDLIRVAGEHFPKPWAEGVHNVWIRVEVTSVSGRRLTALTSGLAY